MGYELAMHISSEFSRGLVVFDTAARIELLRPFGTLYYNILACLGHTDELGVFFLG